MITTQVRPLSFSPVILLHVHTVFTSTPSALSDCLFPALLTSMQAGTLGRFVGNGVTSLVAQLTGLDTRAAVNRFSALLHMGLAAAFAALLAASARCWAQLRVV